MQRKRAYSEGLVSSAASLSVEIGPGLDPVAAMSRVSVRGRTGYVDLNPLIAADFAPVVELPGGRYALEGVETGGDLRNVSPDDAARVIADRGRSPLTMEEGVALLLAHPAILRERNCFQMLGSRAAAPDKRIPSLWITKQGRPRLGWCWAGNPHTWLGAASCAVRVPLE